jgi:hemerythrin superfamily protein
MDGIKMLDQQHEELDDLLHSIEREDDDEIKVDLLGQIADALAMHASIEEKIFYPAVRAHHTGEILLESLRGHLAIKRVLVDLLDLHPADEVFDGKIALLRDEVAHHVEKERTQLFPTVKQLLDRDQLEALGQEMEAMLADLEGTEPRHLVRGELEGGRPPIL